MPTMVRVLSGLAVCLLLILLVAYGVGYYVCVHRHYTSIAAGVDFLYTDEATYTFFRPAIWIYERSMGREVALNPEVYPTPD
jgi:hypothetical protein